MATLETDRQTDRHTNTHKDVNPAPAAPAPAPRVQCGGSGQTHAIQRERESERERERERETSGAMRRQRPCTLQECGVSLGAACVALNSCFFCCCRTTSRTLTAKLAHNCLPNAPTHRRFPLEYMVRNNNYVRTIFIYLYPGGRRIMCSRYVGNAALDVFQRR